MYGIYRYRAGTARINACGDSRLRGLGSRKPIGFRQWVVHDKSTEQKLELVSTQNYNGIVDLVYIKKSEFHGCVMVPILHSVQNVYNKDHGKNL